MPHDLHQKLEAYSGMKLKLRINDNRSTMVSVRREAGAASVSLHRMFLDAPRYITEALALYIRGDHKGVGPKVKSFIDINLRRFDYSHEVHPQSLITQGKVYNLQELYDEVNDQYFDGGLALSITWFGNPPRRRRSRSRIVLGLYYEPLKLIKIHHRLDKPRVPRYVVTHTIYHEMLHFTCPGYVDLDGRRCVHNSAFKKQEKQFQEYHQAKEWVKKHGWT